MSSTRRWRAADPDEIVWVGWQDSFVLFHRPSGKTHFLNAFSHMLLTGIMSEPTTLEELRKVMPAEANDEELEALIARFEELGLLVSA